MSVKLKLGITAGALSLIIVIMFLLTWMTVGKQKDDGLLINLAGRQRMLSQRLAKNYFLVAAKADTKLVHAQLAADAADFRQAMQTLMAAPVSTPAIRGELELAAPQWVFFEAALRRPADEQGLSAVATTSERLLSVMDRLTGLYEAAFREVL